mmetsp:Transcript_28350/g.84893  ORF Transcript_28350/g.84893 Transcript_28350/m.84893 type:complete len:249 (-) Transcript_28350:151-897(-)
MLESLDVAMRKHVQGLISADELVAIAKVYEDASGGADAEGSEGRGHVDERRRFLLSLEGTIGEDAPVAVRAAVQAALRGETVEGELMPDSRNVTSDIPSVGSAADPFAPGHASLEGGGGGERSSQAAGAPAAPPAAVLAPPVAREAKVPDPPAGATAAAASVRGRRGRFGQAKGSPGKLRRRVPKKAQWTWADAVDWLERTYELPQTECDARLEELIRFGFADADAAEALVRAGGDVDKATVLLVAKS